MKNLVLLFVVFIAKTAFAYNVANKTVSKAHVNLTSGYYFSSSEAMLDPHGCGNTTWYKIKDGEHAKAAYSLILAAKFADKKVNFSLDGCEQGYPRVVWINVSE